MLWFTDIELPWTLYALPARFMIEGISYCDMWSNFYSGWLCLCAKE